MTPILTSAEKYDYPVITPIYDTHIKSNVKSANYIKASAIGADSGVDCYRMSFIEFSLEGYEEFIDSSTTFKLRLVFTSDGGTVEDGKAFSVIPLSEEYKNIDLTTISYESAMTVKADGISLVDYMPDTQQYPVTKNAIAYVDVTDYCKSLEDKRALFMIKSVKGAFSINSSESLNIGTGPTLTLENDYTDAMNGAYAVVKNIKDKYDGLYVTDSIDFENIENGFNVEFTSHNEDYITSEGDVLLRPSANEGDKTVKFTVTATDCSYSQVSESGEFCVTLLKEDSYLPVTESISEDSLSLSFVDFTTEKTQALLSFDTTFLVSDSEYSLYYGVASENNLVESFVYDGVKSALIFDVSEYLTEESATFILCGKKCGSNIKIKAVLSFASEQAANAVMSLYTTDLGDLKNVTSDLYLPEKTDDYDLTWTSSNKSVLSDTGRVQRGYEDGFSLLTVKISGEDYTFTLGYNITVIRNDENFPSDIYPRLKDPNHMTDEEFFGKWNENDSIWDIEPILQYDTFSELSDVMAAAKNQDYIRAKSLILNHYRNKGIDETLVYEPKLIYDINADAMNEKIWTQASNSRLIGEGSVGTEWDWYTIDLTGATGNLLGTYWIMDADMDGTVLEIVSRENENGNSAYIEVTVNGERKHYPVVADSYISAGDNSSVNYGNEVVLLCREAAGSEVIPFGTDTARPYFRFDLNNIGSGTVSSVKLNFFARATGDKAKKIYCLNTSLMKNFNESEIVWDGHLPAAFCFKDTGFIWRSILECRTEWGTDVEWINASTRLDQNEDLCRRYAAIGNESYAYRALETVITMYTCQPSGTYPRALDSGWRVENIIKTLYTTINSRHMTPEIFTAFLKYLYDHGNKLKDIELSTTNQASAVNVNYARICAFCPEIAQNGWWDRAKEKLDKLYMEQIINPDGSYTEACSNYIQGVLEEFVGTLDIIKAREGEESQYYAQYKDSLTKLLTYYVNLAYSDGTTPPFGDGARLAIYSSTAEFNEIAQDDELQYIVTYGKNGVKPSYTSRLYSDKAVCMLKSSWDNNSLSAFMNNDGGGSHGHYDDLALDVSAFGANLLVDAGVSSYSTESEFAVNRRRTLFHNTIEIDNKDQVFNSKGNKPGYMNFKTNEAFDFLHSGSYNKMYVGFDVNRKVLMLKNKFLIVSDYIIPYNNQPHTYRQLWHPDYNHNMKLDSDTNIAYTTHASKPNIKIVPVDSGEDAKLFKRLMYANSTVGETDSISLQYYKENVTGQQTFDTVLYPQDIGEDVSITTERINLENTSLIDATAFKIKMGDDTAVYYSSNEPEPALRNFDKYSYNGEMVYVEANRKGVVSYIALTKGSHLTSNGETIVTSEELLNDFSAKYESKTIKLYSSEKLPATGIKLSVTKKYDSVYLNDTEVDFEYVDGFIITNGTEKEVILGDSDLKPGSPIAPAPSGGGNGGGGENSDETETDIPQTPQNPLVELPFSDVTAHWAKEYIHKLYEKGIVSGLSNNSFAPDKSVTRAEFAKLIVTACGIDTSQNSSAVFSDVGSDSWYAPYVNAAYRNSFVSGYEDGSFNPDSFITREEMAKMLCAAADYLNLQSEANDDIDFSDSNQISVWAHLYVRKAYNLGIFKGNENNCFNPLQNTTRAESAAVICRLLENE